MQGLTELEKYLEELEQRAPDAELCKKVRRESASVVDEILNGQSHPGGSAAALHLHPARQAGAQVPSNFLVVPTSSSTSSPNPAPTGSSANSGVTSAVLARMLGLAEKQALFDPHARRDSSSVVEDFFNFEPCPIGKAAAALKPVAAAAVSSSSLPPSSSSPLPSSTWIKQEPGNDKEMDVFDISSTVYDSVMGADLIAGSGGLVLQATTSSLWEDINASISVIDNVSTDTLVVPSSCPLVPSAHGAMAPPPVPAAPSKVKSEPTETGDKPSCQYSKSLCSGRTQSGGLVTAHGALSPFSPASSSSSSPPRTHAQLVNVNAGRLGFPQQQQQQYKSQHHHHHHQQQHQQQQHQQFTPPPPPMSAASPHVVPSMFLPPTPPNSQPASPNSGEFVVRRTPPPPYPGMMGALPQGNIPRPVLSCSPSLSIPLPPMSSAPSSSSSSSACHTPSRARISKPQNTHPGCSTIRYNRKNNPELEKRRIHFCSFPTCRKAYTKSSHLKAHQRIHTGMYYRTASNSQPVLGAG